MNAVGIVELRGGFTMVRYSGQPLQSFPLQTGYSLISRTSLCRGHPGRARTGFSARSRGVCLPTCVGRGRSAQPASFIPIAGIIYRSATLRANRTLSHSALRFLPPGPKLNFFESKFSFVDLEGRAGFAAFRTAPEQGSGGGCSRSRSAPTTPNKHVRVSCWTFVINAFPALNDYVIPHPKISVKFYFTYFVYLS